MLGTAPGVCLADQDGARMSCALGTRHTSCSCGLRREPGAAWPCGHCRDMRPSVWGRPGCLAPRCPPEAEFNQLPLKAKSTPLRVQGNFPLGQVGQQGITGPGFRPQSQVQFWADATCGPAWVGWGPAWPFKRAARGGGLLPSNRTACMYLSPGDQKCPAGHRVARSCPADLLRPSSLAGERVWLAPWRTRTCS